MERNQDQPHQVMFRHLIFASLILHAVGSRTMCCILSEILCGVWDVLLGKSDCSIGVCSSFGVVWGFFK